jgi:succinate dehydrogenase/fumarate reductase flavoprotein subunit
MDDACDVLVIGSGGAGLRAALAARERGAAVAVLCRGTPGKGSATGVSGGVFAGSPPGASPDAHLERTLQAGRGLNRPDLARILVQEAPARLQELIAWGIRADYRDGYLFSRGRPPVWGEAIVNCLSARCRAAGVAFRTGLSAIDLELENGAARVGVVEPRSGERGTLRARAVVLACGGAGGLYARHDNPRGIVGEGYALALRAGATLQDLEFVQFYPIGIAEPGLPRHLVPPRLADHGLLVNDLGEDLYAKYGITERPAAERARDRLSQALWREARAGRIVRLDLTGVSEAQWTADPFSASVLGIIGRRCGALQRPLRIAPMAHHTMGGAVIDPHGATSVPGLFAAGEVAGGLHGANRMGGNALAETLVFGRRAGEAAAEWGCGRALPPRDGRSVPNETSRWGGPFDEVEAGRRLGRLMWEEGGIVRTGAGLSRAHREVDELRARVDSGSVGLQPAEWVRRLRLRAALTAAGLILDAARRRTESRGAHYREDHPQSDDGRWRGHLQVREGAAGREWAFVPA